ncbi:hypothetical protein FQR65_LT20860 [Abscondita terminalis]|nr:hypothetical protein FQR65_LT20860 [Abscondita terminalis]
MFETDKLDWAMDRMWKEEHSLTAMLFVKVEDSEEEVILLQHLKDQKGKFHIYNSLLSEYGVVGFDYGYALASPKTLTIWEAQFGDFL